MKYLVMDGCLLLQTRRWWRRKNSLASWIIFPSPACNSWKLPISSWTGPALAPPPPPQTQCLSLGQEKRVRRFQLFPVIIAVMFTMWFSVCVISQIFNIEIFARGLSFSDSVLVLTSRTNTFSKYSSYLKGALNDWSFLSSYTCMYETQHGQVAIPKD